MRTVDIDETNAPIKVGYDIPLSEQQNIRAIDISVGYSAPTKDAGVAISIQTAHTSDFTQILLYQHEARDLAEKILATLAKPF